MYSVKPGRGPSLMNGVGGIVAAIFGVIWTFAALSLGAPPFFALFGILFVVTAIGGVIYHLYNATGRNRMSAYDVTIGHEENDPVTQVFGLNSQPGQPEQSQTPKGPRRFPGEYCPFCGVKVASDFAYCPKCGKDIRS